MCFSCDDFDSPLQGDQRADEAVGLQWEDEAECALVRPAAIQFDRVDSFDVLRPLSAGIPEKPDLDLFGGVLQFP